MENNINKNELVRDLQETKDFNSKSIEAIKKANDDVPYLTEANRVIEKEIEAIKTIPEDQFSDFP